MNPLAFIVALSMTCYRKFGPFVAFVITVSVFGYQPVFAYAQTVAEPDPVGMSSIFHDVLLQIAAVVIAAAVTWLSTYFKTKLHMDIEAKHRDALQSALSHAAELVINDAFKRGNVKLSDLSTDILDAAFATAGVGIQYVEKSVPQAVNFFGLDNDQILALLRPKLAAWVNSKLTN